MPHDVTSLVNNIILPQTEPSDIIGIHNIHEVSHWMVVENTNAVNLATAYSTGGISTMILIEEIIFIGTPEIPRENIDVKGITERITAYKNS